MKYFPLFLCLILTSLNALSQSTKTIYSFKDTSNLDKINVGVQLEKYQGKKSINVFDATPDKDTELKIVRLPKSVFHNGVIEVELAGEPMKNAVAGARGFVGIAFRMDSANSIFECLYLRPTNGRAEDQIRRNHSAQYISFPDFPRHKLREKFPEKYESYVDLEAGKWTKVKIVIEGNTAKLFVHNSTQPTLIVSDLKHGKESKGSIGLWIGPGTEAHFRNLIVTTTD
jgi:hypothetical protein